MHFLVSFLPYRDWVWVEEQLVNVTNGHILAQEAINSGACDVSVVVINNYFTP